MINYDLKAFERAFAFQIKSQDPRVKSILDENGGVFYASNGWKIRISKVPEVNVFSKTIYLRGSDSSKDIRIDRTWNVPSNYYRDTVIKEVSDAITQLISWVESRLTIRTSMRPSYGIGYPVYSYFDEDVSTSGYFASEAEASWNGRFDSEGWGPNKLDPSKTIVIL